MKWLILLLISTIFNEVKTDWIDSNRSLINSKLYQIHFSQKNKIMISGKIHSDTLKSNIIYLDHNIKYEANDRVVKINPDSLIIFNKVNNQIFIDDLKEEYKILSSINIVDILKNSKFDIVDNYYYYDNNDFPIKIYFSNNNLEKIEFNYEDISVELFSIKISHIDSAIISNYFIVGNSSSSIFDLRIK